MTTPRSKRIQPKARLHPELLFWCVAFILLAVTAGLTETVKLVFLGVVGIIWVSILLSAKWSGPSILSFALFLLAWVWIWKV